LEKGEGKGKTQGDGERERCTKAAGRLPIPSLIAAHRRAASGEGRASGRDGGRRERRDNEGRKSQQRLENADEGAGSVARPPLIAQGVAGRRQVPSFRFTLKKSSLVDEDGGRGADSSAMLPGESMRFSGSGERLAVFGMGAGALCDGKEDLRRRQERKHC
jgi:hypothetical protein